MGSHSRKSCTGGPTGTWETTRSVRPVAQRATPPVTYCD